MPPGTVLHETLAWDMGNGIRFGADGGDDESKDN